MAHLNKASRAVECDWLPDWRGQAVAVLGGGPSLNQADIDLLKGRARVIAINEAWRLCPWADMLYGADALWWQHRGPKAHEFAGLRVGMELRCRTDVRVGVADENTAWSLEPGIVASGSNSGFQVAQIAAQAGGEPILLLGFDMKVDAGLHWHGRHGQYLNNPTAKLCRTWIRKFAEAVPIIEQAGITIINCTPNSALDCFPRMTIEDALGGLRP